MGLNWVRSISSISSVEYWNMKVRSKCWNFSYRPSSAISDLTSSSLAKLGLGWTENHGLQYRQL
jgi:hypothetical protein